MTDSKQPFLQASALFSHPDDPEEYMCMIVSGNPTLLLLLKVPLLDMYIDATFDCTPDPFFYQTLIFMIYYLLVHILPNSPLINRVHPFVNRHLNITKCKLVL